MRTEEHTSVFYKFCVPCAVTTLTKHIDDDHVILIGQTLTLLFQLVRSHTFTPGGRAKNQCENMGVGHLAILLLIWPNRPLLGSLSI